jgi:hypothetical protein
MICTGRPKRAVSISSISITAGDPDSERRADKTSVKLPDL